MSQEPTAEVWDTVEHWIESLTDSVCDDPRNIERVAGLPFASIVFERILEARPDDLRKLFNIARDSRYLPCLTRLAGHAIAKGRADELIFLFLRLRTPWHDELSVAQHVQLLSKHAKALTCLHVLRAANPVCGLWFAKALTADVFWRSAIECHLARRDYRRAYEYMIMAGQGLRVHRYDPAYILLDRNKRSFLSDVKDRRKRDDTYWLTYARAKRFGALVRIVWHAHVNAGILPNDSYEDAKGIDKVRVNVIKRNDQTCSCQFAVRRVPYRGLVARFADMKTVGYEFMNGLPFVSRPRLEGASLRSEGAMLQRMILHWMPEFVSWEEVAIGPSRGVRAKRLPINPALISAFETRRQ